jgi:trehalose-phosphatase
LDLPAALERWPEMAGRLAGRRPALFLDYDGTLSPIVQRPELALLPAAARELLRRLAARMPVAILSGRLREDVAALVGLPRLIYAGSHGFDIAGPPPASIGDGGAAPPLRHEVGRGVPARMARVAERLRRELAGIDGVLVEDKRFAVAVHDRLVDDRDLPRVEAAVDRAAAAADDDGGPLRKTGGKRVWELRPDVDWVDWDKGKALLWLLGRLGLDRPDVVPIFLGDDVTDEDAFAAAASRGGIGILVAEEPRATAAGYRLRDPAEVLELLARLAALAEDAEPAEGDKFGAGIPAPGGSERVEDLHSEAILEASQAPPAAPAALPDDAPLTGEWRPGKIQTLGPLAVPGHTPRLVRVYLPSTFTPEGPRFALYMFDGQNMFDDHPSFSGGWHLHEAVERMARGKRPAPVVIGIDHGGTKRIDELSPFEPGGATGGLDGLLDWIVDSLMPRLAAELPLIPGPVGAVVGGSSMGGLAALYAHFRKPRDFGGALAMSPSFWVGGGEILRWVRAQPTPELSRIYLDCGVREGRGTLLPQVAEMAAHLATRGYDSDHLMFRADPRGAHSEGSWRRRLPRALRFFYRNPTRQASGYRDPTP